MAKLQISETCDYFYLVLLDISWLISNDILKWCDENDFVDRRLDNSIDFS